MVIKNIGKLKIHGEVHGGEQGHVLICRNCNANGRAGECGILEEPSYPTF